MEKTGMRQLAFAGKAGISQSHLSEILRSVSSVSVDLLADLARAAGCQPWELLADSEETRRAAIDKMLGGAPSGPQ